LLAEPSAGAYDGAPFDCAVAREPKAKLAVPSPRFDAFAASAFADAAGRAHLAIAVREPSGRLELRMDDAPARAPEGSYGAQLAILDLDLDGTPEIVTTVDGTDDAISIFTWPSATSDLVPRLRLAAAAGVHALAACPPEQRGEPALVAIVGNEVWVLRAAAAPLKRAGP
jgi:hypothetical protein